MPLDAPFQFSEFTRQLRMARQYLPELHKSTHDSDVDLDSLFAMQDAR